MTYCTCTHFTGRITSISLISLLSLTLLDPGIKGHCCHLGASLNLSLAQPATKMYRKLKKAVQNLAKRQNNQGALLSEALSLINITRVNVKDNRHAINDLVNATDYLLKRTKEIKHIKDELNALRTFVIAHSEFNLIVTELRDNINKFRSHLENLELTLDTLGLNKWSLL